MKTMHTPGPWVVEGTTIEAPHAPTKSGMSRIIGDVLTGCTEGIDRVGSKAEQKANARLIAAAPDLLAALEKIVKINGSTGGAKSLVTEFKTIAELAIAKAKDGA